MEYFGTCVFGSDRESKDFEKIKNVIDPNNINDAVHLCNHVRDKQDYFVTEDKDDILSHKNKLEKTFSNLTIRTPNELAKELS